MSKAKDEPRERTYVVEDAPDSPWVIGEKYLIRTVTYHVVGRLLAVHQHELVMEDAAKIVNFDRLQKSLVMGGLAGVEPFTGRVIVGRGALIDATTWRHALPHEKGDL